MNKHKLAGVGLAVVLAGNLVGSGAALAQGFIGGGGSPGSIGSDPDDTPNGKSNAQAAPAPSNPSFPSVDNTADEKRMQRKFKANLNKMKELISRGEAMMKAAPNQSDKGYKKGKILKETGEKHLAEMQANSPYQLEMLEAEKKKDKESK